MGSDRIAFTRVYAGAPVGRSVASMLRTTFGEEAVDVLDISRMLKKHPWLLASNGVVAAGLYGPAVLGKHKRARSAFLATPYLHRHVNRLINAALDDEYRFTIQLQSIFDASLPGTPHFIYTDHTHLANLEYEEFDPQGLHAPSWLALEKATYARAAHIFTRSTNISRSVIEQYDVPAEKVTCVYAGANSRIVPFDPPAARYEAKNILFVGIDWERKGGPELVSAFKMLLERHPDARLTIVGAAPDINHPNVTVVGRVPVDRVHEYYRQASIFCLPTRLEPFGIVFIEAMAYRLPIVSTRVGALPDMVEDGKNGFLVAPGEVAPLVHALDTLLQSASTRQKFGEAGFELAQNRYNWRAVGQRMRQVIEDTLEDEKRYTRAAVG